MPVPIQRSTNQSELQFVFENNIVYWNGGTLFTGNWGQLGYRCEHNIYWDEGFAETDAGKAIRFGPWTLLQGRQRGQDLKSIIADSAVRESRGEDFTLKSGSPALKLRFSPIDVSNVGPGAGPPSLSSN